MRIDAGGKQCPIPVIMAKKELEAGEQDVEIIVDGPTQVGNLERLGDALGRKASSEPFGDKFLVKFANGETINIRFLCGAEDKSASALRSACHPPALYELHSPAHLCVNSR